MSISALKSYWAEAAKYIHWYKPWQDILKGEMSEGTLQWFSGGELNVSFNCVDRHLSTRGEHPAIIWEGDHAEEQLTLTYQQLYEEVCRMSNVLRYLGIRKGDRVGIYLPLIPEAAIAMLACARIGAVHTVIFAGFSAEALRSRLIDAECKLLITADEFKRGGKHYHLEEESNKALENLNLKKLLILHHPQTRKTAANQTFLWSLLREEVDTHAPAEPMAAEDPLFILYTSGSTGKPKGLVHTTGGYLVQVSASHREVFNCSADEIFWCTADLGWITGHSYVLYGTLSQGLTTLMFAGIPTWPNPSRYWEIIDRYGVNVFYTSPTAIRALMRAGEQWLASSSLTSLRLLGSVGEPINPEVWRWYAHWVGRDVCSIVDTWWQTETGAIMISPDLKKSPKPGAAGQPLPGIYPVLLDEQDKEISGASKGRLAIQYPWPALARTILGDQERYLKTYFVENYYVTGDGASRDEAGDYWINGRIDDVLNVSGHRLGSAEIESALLTNPAVAEAAVVPVPHTLKGQGIYAFVTLKQGVSSDDALRQTLKQTVVTHIGAIARPDAIEWLFDLPKTRSGKIMRRILRLFAAQEIKDISELGDISTLANPESVELLFKQKREPMAHSHNKGL